jgi:DNA polymerase-3 subunit delta'
MDWKIFGHDWAVTLLQAHAGGEKLRHAYLFIGPEGVGRQTLALRFAQALNCRQATEPGQMCGICRDCRQIEALQYPDLSVLLPEEGHRDILIDQVRRLQHTLSLAPFAANYRIALLPNFKRVTTEAANALLKTLEEPSDKVVLLLTASTLESLLPTIVSRCEVIRLRPAPLEKTREYLMAVKGLSLEKADLFAHLSSGRIGAATRFADEPELLTLREESLEMLLELLPAVRVDRFSAAERLCKPYNEARQNVGDVLPYWLTFWRDVFIRNSGADLPLVNQDLIPRIDQAASQINFELARELVLAHEKAQQDLDAYANVKLIVETLMLRWPYVSI